MWRKYKNFEKISEPRKNLEVCFQYLRESTTPDWGLRLPKVYAIKFYLVNWNIETNQKQDNSDSYFFYETKHIHHLGTLADKNTQIPKMSHSFKLYLC